MPTTYKKRILRTVFWFALLFALFFSFRLLYGYSNPGSRYGVYSGSTDFFSGINNLRKNYASEKLYNNVSTLPAGGGNDAFNSQKYEKTATVSSTTSEFSSDDTLIRRLTGRFDGSIQYETSLGKKGSRELHLSIGVRPAVFDSFYRAVQTIGDLRSTTISKVDKTNEYRQLNAKKASLEQTLTSLNELKNKAGAIGDYVSLHDKILEIETQLQELGVDLGNFNSENEFCTLRFSLFEGSVRKSITFFQRVTIALEWTIKYYAVFIVALAGVLLCSFLLLLIIDRFKLLTAIISKLTN